MSRDDHKAPPAFKPPTFEEMPLAEQFRKLQEQVQDGIRNNRGNLTDEQLEVINEHVNQRFLVAGSNLSKQLGRLNRGHDRVWGSSLDKEPEPDKASDESASATTD